MSFFNAFRFMIDRVQPCHLNDRLVIEQNEKKKKTEINPEKAGKKIPKRASE